MAEQKKFLALLFDTRSIQRYIYSGNKLRTNIGASFIVDRLFDDILIDGVLKKMFRADNFPLDETWDAARDTIEPWAKFDHCCVAYVGGGNALLLFDPTKEDRRVEVVENFTRKLLVERPGLRVGAAQGELTIDPETQSLNQDDITKLYAELKRNQNNVFPAVNVPYTGLTLSCEVNGEAANAVWRKDGVRFYSQEVRVKLDAADDANRDLKERFEDIFERKGLSPAIVDYEFPTQFEDLGQKEKNNYFAIVHVDGNNMGAKFRTCETLSDRRRLSREIKRKTEGAFAGLVDRIIRMIEGKNFGEAIELKKNFLPIRPLIIGGDDITFVCPATVALMFTKTLMELMSRETPSDAPEHLTQSISRRMDCCAGITILPTAYPFFRGYELTEELCGEAKRSMRLISKGVDDGSSWLDFAILHGEQAPTLDQIRAREYRGARGDMHFGPYRVDNREARTSIERRYDVENLLECTAQFEDDTRIARNKVKELRDVLQHGRDEAARFFQQLAYQNQRLPEIDDWRDYATDLGWSAEREPRTPYVDAIEMTDFYFPEVMSQWQDLT